MSERERMFKGAIQEQQALVETALARADAAESLLAETRAERDALRRENNELLAERAARDASDYDNGELSQDADGRFREAVRVELRETREALERAEGEHAEALGILREMAVKDMVIWADPSSREYVRAFLARLPTEEE